MGLQKRNEAIENLLFLGCLNGKSSQRPSAPYSGVYDHSTTEALKGLNQFYACNLIFLFDAAPKTSTIVNDTLDNQSRERKIITLLHQSLDETSN